MEFPGDLRDAAPRRRHPVLACRVPGEVLAEAIQPEARGILDHDGHLILRIVHTASSL